MLNKFKNIFIRTKIGNFNANAKRLYPEEFEDLCNILPELIHNSPLAQFYWHISNNIIDIPLCKYCVKKCCWDAHNAKYSDYCSVKCANKDPDILNKRKNTNNKKYGGNSPTNSSNVRNKQHDTMIKKYGVKYTAQSPELFEKMKNSNIKKYGVENPLSNKNINNKCKQTLLEKYGVENPSQNKTLKNKAVITSFKKYGAGNNQNAMRNNCFATHSVYHYSQIDIGQDKLDKYINNKEWLFDQHHVNKLSLTEIAISLNVSVYLIWSRFKEFNIKVIRFNISTAQKEINEFINNFYPTIINDRSILHPYEIDILVPEKNIGIEYNGVVWHSDNLNGKNKNYHLNKTKHCEHNGIRLIQILSPEWLYKKDIVKSRLSHILGRSEKIYGRKCEIKKLEYKIVSKFLEETHIQGSIKSSINYGLFYNNNLVSVMTFSKSRFTKHEYELLRFSNKLNTYVVGGASRLFKQFIKDFNPKSIVSYSDRRWNTGNLYKMLGFTFSHNATPNYFYFNLKQNTDKLYSRLQFQKHKLKDKLDNFKPNLSEWENMKAHGWDRIWDCGNSVWEFNF